MEHQLPACPLLLILLLLSAAPCSVANKCCASVAEGHYLPRAEEEVCGGGNNGCGGNLGVGDGDCDDDRDCRGELRCG